MSLVHQNWWLITLLTKQFKNCPPFTQPAGLGRLIGKPKLFSLNNGWAKFYQVDSHSRTAEMPGEF